MLDPFYLQRMHVGKTLRAGQPGTRRVQRHHGSALVCLRYRYDARHLYRVTTVELVIDHRPVHPRAFQRATFGLDVGPTERDLHRLIKAAGGRWDPEARHWRLRGREILDLGLIHRIIDT